MLPLFRCTCAIPYTGCRVTCYSCQLGPHRMAEAGEKVSNHRKSPPHCPHRLHLPHLTLNPSPSAPLSEQLPRRIPSSSHPQFLHILVPNHSSLARASSSSSASSLSSRAHAPISPCLPIGEARLVRSVDAIFAIKPLARLNILSATFDLTRVTSPLPAMSAISRFHESQ